MTALGGSAKAPGRPGPPPETGLSPGRGAPRFEFATAGRIVFGTGHQSHNGAAIAALAGANLTAAQCRQIAHGNLDRLTGLPPTLWQRSAAGP